MFRVLLAVCILGLSLSANALDIHGVKLADKASVGGHELLLNGAGTRTKVVFKVYVGSLYLPQAAKDTAGVLAQSPRRIRMDLLRNLSADQLSDALLDGLKDKNSDAGLSGGDGGTAQMGAGMGGFPTTRAIRARTSRCVSRLIVSGVTCGRPTHGGENSGRNVTNSRTRSV